jgi:hypothetical protein
MVKSVDSTGCIYFKIISYIQYDIITFWFHNLLLNSILQKSLSK